MCHITYELKNMFTFAHHMPAYVCTHFALIQAYSLAHPS